MKLIEVASIFALQCESGMCLWRKFPNYSHLPCAGSHHRAAMECRNWGLFRL